MDPKSSSVEGIYSISGKQGWDAIDIMWCTPEEVDGYLSGDFYGERLDSGWYFGPLVKIGETIFEVPPHCEGPRGPFATREQAFGAAQTEVEN